MYSIADMENILKFYIESGVDNVCGNTCLNLFESKEKINTPSSSFRRATTSLAQDITASKMNARESSLKAQTLSDLKQMLENFDGCALRLTAKSTVFGVGKENADLMIIGEAPGADEDRVGLPFVGRSGRLLEKMLHAIALKREDVYITNVVPWRPPGNRTPTDSEIAICLPFLKRQIELVAPKIILLLGGSAANALLENSDSISRLRGQFLTYQLDLKTQIPAIASFHPAFLLRNPAQKSKSWVDFLRIEKKLKEI